MRDFDHMPNYADDARLANLRVLHLSGEGILLHDASSGMFTVAWDPLVDCFRLVAVPAWPFGAYEEIERVLSEVYDEDSRDLWLRSARVKGWDHETALERAQALKERA